MSRQRVRYLCTIGTLCHMKSNFLEFCHILVDRCVCCVCRWGLEIRRRFADGLVFEDVDVEVEGAGEREGEVGQLDNHVKPERPGLLLH